MQAPHDADPTYDSDVSLIAASLAPGVGPVTLAEWWESDGHLPTTAARLDDAARTRELLPAERALIAAMSAPSLRAARHLLDAWRSGGMHVVTWAGADFPSALRTIPASPPVLFTSGACPDDLLTPPFAQATVAIVGTRRPSSWGAAFARRLAADCAARGMVVVSGLALGIDGAAHEGVVGVDPTKAVAVLGGALDRMHPREHAALADQIAMHGLLVSEFPPGTSPSRATFPRRNRIISGLARAVVVVEAGEKTGVEHTIRYALEQGRDVYVVVTAPDGSYGLASARRAKGGAIPFTTVDDLVADSLVGSPLHERQSQEDIVRSRIDADDTGLVGLARTIYERAVATGGGSFERLVPGDVDIRDGLAVLDALTAAGWLRSDGPATWLLRRSANEPPAMG